MGEIDIVTAESALADQHRDFGCVERGAKGRGIDHHARKPRRQRQLPQLLSFIGDAPIGVDGAKLRQQGLCFRERRARRWVEKSKLLGRRTPGGKIKREGRKIRRQNFRPRKRLERRGLRLVPQPVTDARLDAAGAAAPLIGRRARHPHGLEPRHADIRLEARHAREAGIDDDAHAFDR